MSFTVPGIDEETQQAGALYVPAGQGLTKWVSGDSYTMKATRGQTGGRLGFIEAIVPPGGGPVAHAHEVGDETFYLLEGELEFLDGDKTFVAGPGDFVYVPQGHRHRFKNISDRSTRMLFFYTPAGAEEFFVQAGEDPVPGQEPPVWDLERIMSVMPVAERTGLIVLPEEEA